MFIHPFVIDTLLYEEEEMTPCHALALAQVCGVNKFSWEKKHPPRQWHCVDKHQRMLPHLDVQVARWLIPCFRPCSSLGFFRACAVTGSVDLFKESCASSNGQFDADTFTFVGRYAVRGGHGGVLDCLFDPARIQSMFRPSLSQFSSGLIADSHVRTLD
jgi:hypothetical protein